MRSIMLFAAALLFSAVGTTALAQNGEKERPALMGSNSEGFRFMLGFMQNEIDDGWLCWFERAYLSVSVASRFDANFRVTLPDGRFIDSTVQARQVVEIQIPWYFECVGEGVFKAGIEVVADRPVSVTGYNSKQTTSDGYLALPVNSWGTQYISANYYVDQYDYDPEDGLDCWAVPRRGEFAVIAAEDNTVVNVYPSTRTVRGVAAGQLYRMVLQKGEIFQVQDGGEDKRTIGNPGTDITGSVITASKPVGLLSGHVRSGVPNVHNTKDHLVEMLPPRNALGKRYMVVPFGSRTGGDIVRVISTVGAITNVEITSIVNGTSSMRLLTTGEFADYDILDPILITADQPVLVTHYSRSQDAGIGSSTASMFDPDMVVVTPEEQFVNGAVFQTLSNDSTWVPGRGTVTKFNKHFVALVGERATFDATMLDGRPIGAWDKTVRGEIPSSEYSYAVIEVPHNMTHVIESEGMFGGYVYGIGNVDSYAWPVGSGLRQFDIVDADPPMLTSRPICGASEVIAVDSGRTQLGLARVWLDTAASTNALFEKTFVIVGDELSLGHVRPVDPRLPAFGRVWAEDLAGQRTSIDVTISSDPPTFSSDAISFGEVIVGQVYPRAFTIGNPGPASIIIDSIYLRSGSEFGLDKAYRNMVIAGDGGQLTLTLLFRTDVRVTAHDTLIIVADCREYRIPLMAIAATPQIATHDLDFTRIRIGRERTMQIIVSNPGDAPLRVDSAVIDGVTFTRAGELAWPVLIAPKEDTVALSVTFRPTATRRFDGTVRFYGNVEDSVALSNLTGVGIYPTLSILGHDFGRVQIGDTVCTTIPVANIGTDTAFLRGLTLPDPESFLPDQRAFDNPTAPGEAYPLAPGDTLWVPVCFAPSGEREYRSDVSPRNDDDLTAMNTLHGEGFRPRARLGGKDMGRHWIGTSTDSVVYLRNIGTDPITISRIWLEGGDESDFIIDTLDAEITLAPGASHAIGVTFSPIEAGHRQAHIHAQTTSRHQPQLDSVLVGFGLFALSSDVLELDDELAYACGERAGRIVIRNEGNTPLTIASIGYTSDPPVMILNMPDPGYVIDVGGSLPLDFNLALGGYAGVTQGTVSWSFEEPPNVPMKRQFTREFSLASTQQQYYASSEAPAKVIAGEMFDLDLSIDSAAWPDVLEREVTVAVRFDPKMTRFDVDAWKGAAEELGPWRRGEAVVTTPGIVEATYVTATGDPLPLAGVALPPLPFTAYLGERSNDTLVATITAVGNVCATPVLASSPIALDSICGLAVRLFEFTGSPFVLRQNQPNPVVESTEIFFTLAMEAATRLEIFAADGTLVRLVIDAVMPAGDYSIPLDARSLSSGTYYYRLTSGTFSASRPMQVSR